MTPNIDLLTSHRSIRHFTDEPITEAQREASINSARATSSSSFLQCSSIIRITDPAMREQLVALTGGQKHVAQAVLNGGWISQVSRDDDDGMWQFHTPYGDAEMREEDGRVVRLYSMWQRDPSVAEVADALYKALDER